MIGQLSNAASEFSNDDQRLIMHKACDDLTAFAPLYEHYFSRVYAYCLRRVNSPQEAEDLTSLIFSRALRNVHNYRGGTVQAWLFTIAHNTVANYYRDDKPRVSLDVAELPLTDPAQTPAEALLESEQALMIRTIVASLPVADQELLALKINAGLTAEEIGMVLDKKPGTVRVTLHRIIKRLRALYLKELQ